MNLPEGLVLLAAGVFGLIAGSYLNVVAYRLPRGLSTVSPPSACPRCGHRLSWFENVPVLSWLALRGRCRACRMPISPRYAAIELLTAGCFVAAVAVHGQSWNALRLLILLALLVALTVIDLEFWVLPFELTLPGIAAGVLTAIPLGRAAFIESLLGAGIGFGGFWALERLVLLLLKREGLGAGDKYLVALIGAFLGWRSLFGLLLLSNVQGAVVGVILLLLHGRAAPGVPEQVAGAEDDGFRPGATHLPFGPWLSLAAAEIALLLPLVADRLPGTLAAVLGAGGVLP